MIDSRALISPHSVRLPSVLVHGLTSGLALSRAAIREETARLHFIVPSMLAALARASPNIVIKG